MTNYTQSGQPHGLKSLAQELRSYGRNGDTVLAHINPQEAGILRALGGSGTINPHTGLPEYFFKAVSRAVAAPFKAVNQVVKAIPVIGPAIDKGLVSLDKAVGSAIPGGWNTLAQTALAFTPLGLPARVGLAALGGSGAFGPKGKFNFQRALMSGALAYGAGQLAEGLQAAGGAGADATAGQIASNLGVEGASALPGSQAAMLAEQAAGFGEAGLRNIASSAGYNALPSAGANAFAYNAAGELVPASVAPQITGATTNISPNAAPGFFDKIGATDFVSQTGDNLAAAGRGVQNLTGFGTGAKAAGSAFTGPVTTGGMTALAMGTMGLAQLDEQEKMLSEQYQQGQVNDTEYNRQMALIADGRRRAEEAVRANPYQFAKGGEVPGYFGGGTLSTIVKENVGNIIDRLQNAGKTPEQIADSRRGELSNLGIKQNILDTASNQQLQDYVNAMRKSEDEKSAYRSMINNPYGFARGGSIDDELGGDYSAMGMDQGNLQKGLFGMGYAMGGQPRFLSGGGDGMSDSIQATINDKQPARLADGEFVVPADVVSGIGNGSSKAGAKRLYGMMDRVRKERTGTTKQAKAVNPAKVMAA
jgi:hypothetical protein